MINAKMTGLRFNQFDLRKIVNTLWIPCVLFLMNFLLKGIFLSSNSLGGDEPFSVYHAQMDVFSIIKLLTTGNNPPLYEIILHFWIQMFGISEFAVRFPSLIFSSVTVLFIYYFALKHLNKRVALYSSLLFILSNYHISFAHEARVYAFLGMLTVASMYYFMELLHSFSLVASSSTVAQTQRKVRKNIIALITTNILLIYSHYFGFFVLATQFLFVIVHRQVLLAYWKQFLFISAIIVLLYSPILLVFIHRFMDSSQNGTWIQKPNGIFSLVDIFRLFTNNPYGETFFDVQTRYNILNILFKIPVAIFSFLVIVVSLSKSLYRKDFLYLSLPTKLTLLWFSFSFFFMFAISYYIPMFLDRYLMHVAVAFCIVMGILVDYILTLPQYRYIVPTLIIVLFGISINPDVSNNRNVKELVDKVTSLKTDRTLVLFCPYDFVLTFSYYYNRQLFQQYDTDERFMNLKNGLITQNVYGVNAISEVDLSAWDHVVYVDAAADFTCPNNNILDKLTLKYSHIQTKHIHEIFNIYEYGLK